MLCFAMLLVMSVLRLLNKQAQSLENWRCQNLRCKAASDKAAAGWKKI